MRPDFSSIDFQPNANGDLRASSAREQARALAFGSRRNI